MTSLVDESGRFRPRDELEALLTGDRDARSITYCGGGIAATLDAFLQHQLGYRDIAVYDASMSEWAKDEALPIEQG
jgi:thiosulfate/3-mercaptopyruvate sulfurtransferase